MACGTMCIRSPITHEDVVDSITGFLVDPRDEPKMVDRILQVFAISKIDYRKRSLIAREKIVKCYTWDEVIDRVRKNIDTFGGAS
jgi:glycosyltransferase involved in cell wall biosynthesis